jgi:hypothetical protein
LTEQAIPTSLPRYDILEGSGVSTLNQLLHVSTDDDLVADLILRDPQNGAELHVTIVEVTLEHDPAGGAMFFNGVLDTGIRINGHIRPTADPTTGLIGSANIRF